MKKINNVLKVLHFILISIIIFFLGGIYQEMSESKFILLKTNNINKAVEINDFLENENIHIKKSDDKYVILTDNNSQDEYIDIMIKLAENNFIDEDFIIFRDKDFSDKNKINKQKKYIENIVTEEIKHIEGVYGAKTEFIPPKENHSSKFVINAVIFNDYNQEKINKTINALLALYPDSEKTITFSKSGYFFSDKEVDKVYNQMHIFCKNKQYQKASILAKQTKEKKSLYAIQDILL